MLNPFFLHTCLILDQIVDLMTQEGETTNSNCRISDLDASYCSVTGLNFSKRV